MLSFIRECGCVSVLEKPSCTKALPVEPVVLQMTVSEQMGWMQKETA